jgi:hypothetical protein
MARVVWSDEAERFLLGAPVDEAEEILAAVERMAGTGHGFVRQMVDAEGTLGLYVRGCVVLFLVHDDGGIEIRRVRRRP